MTGRVPSAAPPQEEPGTDPGGLPADLAARQQALDPDRSFLVQAPAGSGKTGLLTQRFLRLLSLVDHPEEIVAITFTRKAAAEMRSRILLALAATGKAPSDPNGLLTHRLAAAARQRDRERGWELPDHPNRLRVVTIDALCASLVRQMPLFSRFGGRAAVTEEPTPFYRAAARDLIDELDGPPAESNAVACLLAHLDNRPDQLESLLIGMLAKREQWLRHLTSSHPLTREHLEGNWGAIVRANLQTVLRQVPDWVRPRLPDLARRAASRFRDEGSPRLGRWLAPLPSWPGTDPLDLPEWLELAAWLLTNEGTWRRNVTVRDGFPPPSGAANQEEKKRRTRDKADFVDLLTDLSLQAESWRVVLHGLRDLPPAVYTDAQWEAAEALARILPRAAGHLMVRFAAQGVVDFSAVAQGALAALGGPQDPTDLAIHLDDRIQHLLVDEFQDTSLGQYQLLQGLTAGWDGHDGRTLFLVGDPMQSIYRFREAEVSLFYRARREGIGAVRLEPLTLSVNFRSTPAIIDWINRTFAAILPAQPDLLAGAVPYSPSQPFATASPPHSPDQPVVRFHTQVGHDGGEREARKVVQTIVELRTREPGATIAVLVRARTHAVRILATMRQQLLPFQAVELEPLRNQPVIRDLLALLDALTQPCDRLAWLTLLRGPWCGLTLVDLHRVAGGEDPSGRGSLWERMNDPEVMAGVTEPGRLRVARLAAVIGPALLGRRRRPLRTTLEGVWQALGGPAVLLEAKDRLDTDAFFDLVAKNDRGGELEDRREFIARLDRLYSGTAPDADPRLQILTIHKAKGLEFDHVLLPGLGRPAPPPETHLLQWAETPQTDGPPLLLLAPIKGAELAEDPFTHYLNLTRTRKDQHEAGRLLYVAATRAKRSLHLFGHLRPGTATQEPAPDSRSLLARFDRTAYPDAPDTPVEEIAGDSASPVTLPTLFRLPLDFRHPPFPPPMIAGRPEVTGPEESPPFDWAGEAIRLTGTVAHRLLLLVAREGAAAWNDWRLVGLPSLAARLLREYGTPEPLLPEAQATVVTAITRTLHDERGRWILDSGHVGAVAEWDLCGLRGGVWRRSVLDRSFIDQQGLRWIIDYKISRHGGSDESAFLDQEVERYRPQLTAYARLVAALEDRPIRCGLYFPLQAGWREWAFLEAGAESWP